MLWDQAGPTTGGVLLIGGCLLDYVLGEVGEKPCVTFVGRISTLPIIVGEWFPELCFAVGNMHLRVRSVRSFSSFIDILNRIGRLGRYARLKKDCIKQGET